jgi:hypothetical protein
MQRDLHPWALFLGHIHEVCVDTPKDGLVCNNEDIFAALKLHNDGLEADNDVAIRFAAQVTVVVFVFITLRKVLGILLFYLCVGQTIANSRVEFVQSFPFELFK